jgi:hypothetical protein
MQKRMESQKYLQIDCRKIKQSHYAHLSKGKEFNMLLRHRDSHDYCSTSHNRQDMESMMNKWIL